MTSQPEFFCPSCAAVVAFEQPPCSDGHEECLDLACTLCGTALFAGGQAPWPQRRRRHRPARRARTSAGRVA
ncbi:MAG: hypothetical protein GEV07_01865 [Streptosporangiales bacterium]|nr:hypothetical protein [Streptosporangiales bacterium]